MTEIMLFIISRYSYINCQVLCFYDFSPEERSSKILSLSRLGYFTPNYKAEILLTLPSLLRPSLASSATICIPLLH
jgi:hypothetical protein